MGFFFNYGITFLCHWEILMRNTLDGAVHHPELEIIPHQVLCWKHLLKWSLGGLDCNAPGLSVILMFAWSAQRPFAGFHPKPKHCLCVIIDKGGHWGQPGGEWISQDGLPSPWIAVSRQHLKGLGIGSQQWSSVGPRVCVKSRAINDVSKDSNWRSWKLTFVFKGQPSFLQAVKPMNEDNIHLTECPLRTLKYLGHSVLEDLWHRADTEW